MYLDRYFNLGYNQLLGIHINLISKIHYTMLFSNRKGSCWNFLFLNLEYKLTWIWSSIHELTSPQITILRNSHHHEKHFHKICVIFFESRYQPLGDKLRERERERERAEEKDWNFLLLQRSSRQTFSTSNILLLNILLVEPSPS